MQFVVVTLNKETNRVICVDGIFNDASAAEDHVELINKRVAPNPKYQVTVEVVTKPR